jgi:hypothetical protein
MHQNDHDLLIVIAEGQRELKNDVRAMSDALKDMKASLDATNQRQHDLESRMANLSTTVQRSLADQRDDHKDIADLKADHTKWKLYMKVALVLMTPIYLVMLALLIEAGKRWLFS